MRGFIIGPIGGSDDGEMGEIPPEVAKLLSEALAEAMSMGKGAEGVAVNVSPIAQFVPPEGLGDFTFDEVKESWPEHYPPLPEGVDQENFVAFARALHTLMGESMTADASAFVEANKIMVDHFRDLWETIGKPADRWRGWYDADEDGDGETPDMLLDLGAEVTEEELVGQHAQVSALIESLSEQLGWGRDSSALDASDASDGTKLRVLAAYLFGEDVKRGRCVHGSKVSWELLGMADRLDELDLKESVYASDIDGNGHGDKGGEEE